MNAADAGESYALGVLGAADWAFGTSWAADFYSRAHDLDPGVQSELENFEQTGILIDPVTGEPVDVIDPTTGRPIRQSVPRQSAQDTAGQAISGFSNEILQARNDMRTAVFVAIGVATVAGAVYLAIKYG